MGGKTSIEWTEETWNPIAGCSIHSPGCAKCYAMKQAFRIEMMGTTTLYNGLTKKTKAGPVWTGALRAANDKVWNAPLRMKRPRMIFVNSMSDLFHEDLPVEWINRAFDIMEKADWHVYQILTKRSVEMNAYLSLRWAGKEPPKHIWIGVSVEDQKRADERIPNLLKTPAAVRFLSMEPLLEHVDISPYIWGRDVPCEQCPRDADCACGLVSRRDNGLPALSWIIIGGESGNGARDFEIEWARSVLHTTWPAHVKVFVKQLGAKPYKDGWLMKLKDRKGGDPEEWPADLRVREMPHAAA